MLKKITLHFFPNKYKMWHYLRLSRSDFALLNEILRKIESNLPALIEMQRKKFPMLILVKKDNSGNHQLIFSPEAFETLSDLDLKLLEFDDAKIIEEPMTTDMFNGYRFLFGDEDYYKSLSDL